MVQLAVLDLAYIGEGFTPADALAKAKLAPLIEATGADELMVAAAIWDHQARVHSFELLAQAMD